MSKPRSKAERTLGDCLDRLRFAAETAGLGFWEWDPTAGRLTADDHTAGEFTLPPGRLRRSLAEAFTGIVHADDLEGFCEALESAAADRDHCARTNHFCRMLRKDGAVRHVDAKFRVMRNARGAVKSISILTRDISEQLEREELYKARAAAEHALVERLSIATQAAGIYVWEYNYRTNKITWDENRVGAVANRHFGMELGSELFKYVHPDDRGIGAESMMAALKRGEPDASFRYRLQLPDGTIRHIQAYARTSVDPDGNPLRSLGVSWDITREVEAAQESAARVEYERRLQDQMQRQTEELRDAQRRLERASLSVLEGHWEIDLITLKHWVSSNYFRLLGYLPDEIDLSTTEKLERIVHPEDVPWSKDEAQNHIDTGAPYDLELRVRVKSGEYRWFRVRGNAERDASGRAIRLSGAIHDIQKQRRAEEELKIARQRFERAIRGTQDGLWEWDLQNRTLWVSPRYEAILGYAEGELLRTQKPADLVIHPEDIPVWRAAQEAHSERDVPFDVEVRMQTKSGEYRWIRARGRAERDREGRPMRVAGSIQDVTEARAARDALIQAKEAAQAANRAKSAFLANVSHEIRTPMNGIIGMTSLLLDTPLQEQQREYAQTIRSSADSLLTVINDILDFSKIEAGKLDIDMVEMDLPGNVEDIGAVMAFQAGAKNLELIVNVHPDVPGHVMGDPQRIRQCLINLIGNAIKFTSDGEVVLEVSREGERSGAPVIRFEVRDTGIGIAPETISSLFQPFVQADASTTRHFGGTGLGLSIVRRLVEMMGGEVGAASEPGKGSTFWFLLPMRAVDRVETEPQHALPRAQRRVLVVDDNATQRGVLEMQLTSAGFTPMLASTGEEALSMLREACDQQPFDVVIADLQMPGVDGAKLAEHMRADARLARIPVIFLTPIETGAVAKGRAASIPKPVRARDLLKFLDHVLETGMAPQPPPREHSAAAANRTDAAERKRYAGKVLLVEDNVVNQKVARKFLERLGCEVTVAENGADGISAWESGDFKLVLMDVQMPVMDGYTATRQIREREGSRARTPVIALTANAMSGQLERCLEAGMDGLLTKPLDTQRLQDVLERYGLKVSGTEPEPSLEPPCAADRAAPLEFAQLMEATGQDFEFARDLVESYVANSRELLTEMRAGNTSDRQRLARAAHQLKGASANVHAKPLRELAARLESHAAELDAAELDALMSQVDVEIERTAEMIRNLTAAAARSAAS